MTRHTAIPGDPDHHVCRGVGGRMGRPWLWTGKGLSSASSVGRKGVPPARHTRGVFTCTGGPITRPQGRFSLQGALGVSGRCEPGREGWASWRSQAGSRVFPPAWPAKTRCQRLPEAQDKSQTLGWGPLAVGPAGSSIRDLAGLECAVRGTGVSFMLCPRAAKTLVIKCHIQWGSPARGSWRAGFCEGLVFTSDLGQLESLVLSTG